MLTHAPKDLAFRTFTQSHRLTTFGPPPEQERSPQAKRLLVTSLIRGKRFAIQVFLALVAYDVMIMEMSAHARVCPRARDAFQCCV